MELSYFLFVGGLSALASTLGHTVAWSGAELLTRREPKEGQVSLVEALMHLLSGLGLGFIYWLSWGFAAIVAVPWWARGLAFGFLCWALLAAPVLTAAVSSRGASLRIGRLHAMRWASTCLIVGVSCAWTWEQAA